MKTIDEFGHDPAVRMMRRAFAVMEVAQKDLLSDAHISFFDPRLRRWREAARELFERGWGRAGQQGIRLTEDEAGFLYGLALRRLMERDGISLSKHSPAGSGEDRMRLIQELVP